MKIRSFKELITHLGDDWQDVVARSLASASHNFVASQFKHITLEANFAKRHIGSLSGVSRGIVSLICHTLSGVAHTVPIINGPVGKFAGTLLGTTLTDLAAHIERTTGEPVTIDMPLDSWRTDPMGSQIILQPAVQEKAARILADRFKQDCRGDANDNPAASQRIRSFLSRVGISIGQFVQNEKKSIGAGVKKYTENIQEDTQRRNKKWF